MMSGKGLPWLFVASALALAACATARMHTQEELSAVERECRLAAGELVQEVELKKALFLYRVGPTPEERNCVHRWARKNHLHLVTIDALDYPEPQQ